MEMREPDQGKDEGARSGRRRCGDGCEEDGGWKGNVIVREADRHINLWISGFIHCENRIKKSSRGRSG